MVDLYIDDVSLNEIRVVGNKQELVFVNDKKDESLHIPVSNEELLNILNRVKMRCETLNLIYPVDIKRKEGTVNEK